MKYLNSPKKINKKYKCFSCQRQSFSERNLEEALLLLKEIYK